MILCVMSAAAWSVEVNTIAEVELDRGKGIGSGVAQRVLQERASEKFSDRNDFVKRVKGAGEKNAAEFSSGALTVNSAAFAAPIPTETD